MFLRNSALLAAPIAAASVPVAALSKDRSDDGLKARLARLEDEAAIRELHRSWLRQVNAAGGSALLDSSVRRITAHPAGVAENIELAVDGRSATGHYHYSLELEALLPADSTLAQMAHAQGTGTVCRTEHRVLTVEYIKAADTWNIGKVALQPG
jgi:hypothetical protein